MPLRDLFDAVLAAPYMIIKINFTIIIILLNYFMDLVFISSYRLQNKHVIVIILKNYNNYY